MTDQEKQAALDALNELVLKAKFYEKDKYDLRGIDAAKDIIRAALSSPAVPVGDAGLMAVFETVIENTSAFSHDALVGIIHRAYAALPKLQKVDLDGMKWVGTNDGFFSLMKAYNSAIDDIKSKYGELYAEVK